MISKPSYMRHAAYPVASADGPIRPSLDVLGNWIGYSQFGCSRRRMMHAQAEIRNMRATIPSIRLQPGGSNTERAGRFTTRFSNTIDHDEQTPVVEDGHTGSEGLARPRRDQYSKGCAGGQARIAQERGSGEVGSRGRSRATQSGASANRRRVWHNRCGLPAVPSSAWQQGPAAAGETPC